MKSLFKGKLLVCAYYVFFNVESKLLILQTDNIGGSIVMTKRADGIILSIENNFPLNMLMVTTICIILRRMLLT